MDEMDIKEALTLALRIRRHQFDANTGNLRSSAQITAFRCIGSDMPTYGSVPPCRHHVHVYTTCRNEAFLQLRVAVRVLRVAVRVLGVALILIALRLLHFFCFFCEA